MALGPAEMIASSILGDANLLHENFNVLWGLSCGLWYTGELEAEEANFSAKHHECGSKTSGVLHREPVGGESHGNKVIPNIVVEVAHEGFEERAGRTVCAFSLTIALGVVRSCAGLV